MTDSVGTVAYDPARPGISNLMTIHSAISGESFEDLEKRFVGSGFGVFKDEVAAVVIARLEAFQARYAEIRDDEQGLRRTLEAGAERARAVSDRTVERVYDALGFVGRPGARRS